jgi:uncharacterized protein (UPF0332 family)
MSRLHTNLLGLAERLVHLDRHRPQQASLRRAISTAYYALFHLLVWEATATLVADPSLRGRFSRAFEHGDMKQASKKFASAHKPEQLANLTGGLPIPGDLQEVALTFVKLQEQRHEADYDVTRTFTRDEVNDLVKRVRQAFQSWQAVREDPTARIYLAALLLWKKWDR